jgi:hypothetical protein
MGEGLRVTVPLQNNYGAVAPGHCGNDGDGRDAAEVDAATAAREQAGGGDGGECVPQAPGWRQSSGMDT